MIRELFPHGTDWHAVDCACDTCAPWTGPTPPPEPSLADDGRTTAIAILAGIATSLLLIQLYALATGRPGILAIFGWA